MMKKEFTNILEHLEVENMLGGIPLHRFSTCIIYYGNKSIEIVDRLFDFRVDVDLREYTSGEWRRVVDSDELNLFDRFLSNNSNLYVCLDEYGTFFVSDYAEEVTFALSELNSEIELSKLIGFAQDKAQIIKNIKAFKDRAIPVNWGMFLEKRLSILEFS